VFLWFFHLNPPRGEGKGINGSRNSPEVLIMDGMGDLSLVSTGIRAIAMLFIVLGSLVSVLFVMKRFLFLRRGVRGDLLIKVLSSLHLSPKERIEVIEISGEKIVLGITPGNISFLTKLHPFNETLQQAQRSRKDHEIKE